NLCVRSVARRRSARPPSELRYASIREFGAHLTLDCRGSGSAAIANRMTEPADRSLTSTRALRPAPVRNATLPESGDQTAPHDVPLPKSAPMGLVAPDATSTWYKKRRSITLFSGSTLDSKRTEFPAGARVHACTRVATGTSRRTWPVDRDLMTMPHTRRVRHT